MGIRKISVKFNYTANQLYATIGKSQGHTHNYTLHGKPSVIAWTPTIHVILLDGDAGGNVYQVRQGLSGIKVAEKEICEAFPKLNTKVKSKKQIQSHMQRGKRWYQLKWKLSASVSSDKWNLIYLRYLGHFPFL